MNQVVRPFIPYRGLIAGGIHEGKKIEIRGHVPFGADVFQINLMAGMDLQSDRPLHISVRFNGRVVVRNALINNSYGSEERSGSFPFTQGRKFSMVIFVNSGAYSVSVNGQNSWKFSHRLPFTRVSSVFIDGDVEIERIHFVNKVTPHQQPATYTPASNPYYQQPAICTPAPDPYYHQPATSGPAATSPWIFPLCGGLRPGLRIHINGRPSSYPQKFTINLQNGSSPIPAAEIAFHLDVRFFNYSIVRNSRNNNVWSSEETMVSHFPFQPDVSFDMVIQVQHDRYMIDVNGQHFLSFRHRLNALSRFNTIAISNDVIITGIRYD